MSREDYEMHIASLTDEELESEVRDLFRRLPADKSSTTNDNLGVCYSECMARKNFSIYQRAYEALGFHQYS